jgi:glutamine amidotransferase
MLNTHPFSHACCGREWVFAHNGLVPEMIDQYVPGALCKPQGETDSEHAFCHLLAAIAGCYEGAENGTWMQRVADQAGTIATFGKFNFLLSDGTILAAYGHDRLHYLEKSGGRRDALALVATEPLTSDAWRRFDKGELRIYRSGQLLMRLKAGAPGRSPWRATSPGDTGYAITRRQ